MAVEGNQVEVGITEFPRAPIAKRNRYGRVFGPKLKSLIAKIDDDGNPFSVTSEIEVARGIHVDSIRLYEEFNAIIEAMPTTTLAECQAQRQAFTLNNSILVDSNDRVLSALERCARITTQVCERVSPQYIALISKQILNMIYRCFDNDQPEFQEGIAKFERMIDEELQLPTIKGQIPPVDCVPIEDQMLAMDMSIPMAPPPADSTEVTP